METFIRPLIIRDLSLYGILIREETLVLTRGEKNVSICRMHTFDVKTSDVLLDRSNFTT